MAKQLWRQLWDDADHPAYTFIEPSVGYRMEQGEGAGRGGGEALKWTRRFGSAVATLWQV